MTYSYRDIGDILSKYKYKTSTKRKTKYEDSVKYIEIPMSFDIETTSFEENGEKKGIMYIWQLAIYQDVIIGRTWDEFVLCLNEIEKNLQLKDNNLYAVIWVHNLSFEYAFIKKWLNFNNVFDIKGANGRQKTARARTSDNIEFRCSYLLTNKSLDKVAEDLVEHSYKKLEYDYDKIRTSDTVLSEDEINYCINDVLIITAYIEECMNRGEKLSTMPMTSTGYIRKECKRIYRQSKDWKQCMSKLKLTEELYNFNKVVYKGAVVHASILHSGKLLKNVDSFDFKSSYPAVMVSERYPSSTPIKVKIKTKEDFNWYIKHKACLFHIAFINLRLKDGQYMGPISESKCDRLDNPTVDNGRVCSADYVSVNINEVEFSVYEKCYDWDGFKLGDFYQGEKDYLPSDFVKYILTLYLEKEAAGRLRDGSDSKEYDYMQAKAKVNSLYGMMATKMEYDRDLNTVIDEYNASDRNFLYPLWATWVTSYAMRNLFSGIYNCGADFVYCDTDSIKILNSSKHIDYINRYNNVADIKIKAACDRTNIDYNMIKGLGRWTSDGHYDKFKTLRSKAYLTQTDNIFTLTMSGVRKDSVKYIEERGGFDYFKNGMHFTSEETGKYACVYYDFEIQGELKDYQGHTTYYYEKSFVNLSPVDYTFDLTEDYIELIEIFQSIGYV